MGPMPNWMGSANPRARVSTDSYVSPLSAASGVMVTVTAADLGAASFTPLFKGAAGALLAAGAAGVIFGTVFFFFPLFTTSVHVSVGGVAEGSPASSGWLRGAAWTVPSLTCASAHVLGASGADTWDFFPFPLPLEGFGAWDVIDDRSFW
ncbi:hypothetical protein SFRURICE_015707 [Spodoptera frugiperda]|nr:hypothetical protein SFRURICE_015707 [Spodoptera frugiperda]